MTPSDVVVMVKINMQKQTKIPLLSAAFSLYLIETSTFSLLFFIHSFRMLFVCYLIPDNYKCERINFFFIKRVEDFVIFAIFSQRGFIYQIAAATVPKAFKQPYSPSQISLPVDEMIVA